MKIGLYGSATGDMDAHAMDVARELGRKIAERAYILIAQLLSLQTKGYR